jgi:hypothetical protein
MRAGVSATPTIETGKSDYRFVTAGTRLPDDQGTAQAGDACSTRI